LIFQSPRVSVLCEGIKRRKEAEEKIGALLIKPPKQERKKDDHTLYSAFPYSNEFLLHSLLLFSLPPPPFLP